jgi:hypothetical protein
MLLQTPYVFSLCSTMIWYVHPLVPTLVNTACTTTYITPPPPKGITSRSAFFDNDPHQNYLGVSYCMCLIWTDTIPHILLFAPSVPCQAGGLLPPQLVACDIQQSSLRFESSDLLHNLQSTPLQNLHTKSIFVYSSWESSMFSSLSRDVWLQCSTLDVMLRSYDHMNTSTPACVSYAPVKWWKMDTCANVILVRITPGIRLCNTDL